MYTYILFRWVYLNIFAMWIDDSDSGAANLQNQKYVNLNIAVWMRYRVVSETISNYFKQQSNTIIGKYRNSLQTVGFIWILYYCLIKLTFFKPRICIKWFNRSSNIQLNISNNIIQLNNNYRQKSSLSLALKKITSHL